MTFKIEIAALSETKKGQGIEQIEEYVLIYNGISKV